MEAKLDTKTTGWVAYLSLIGLVLALAIGDKEGAKFHINQALVVFLATVIAGTISAIPIIGWILGIGLIPFCTICWVLGLVAAINQEEKEVPLLGQIKILK